MPAPGKRRLLGSSKACVQGSPYSPSRLHHPPSPHSCVRPLHEPSLDLTTGPNPHNSLSSFSIPMSNTMHSRRRHPQQDPEAEEIEPPRPFALTIQNFEAPSPVAISPAIHGVCRPGAHTRASRPSPTFGSDVSPYRMCNPWSCVAFTLVGFLVFKTGKDLRPRTILWDLIRCQPRRSVKQLLLPPQRCEPSFLALRSRSHLSRRRRHPSASPWSGLAVPASASGRSPSEFQSLNWRGWISALAPYSKLGWMAVRSTAACCFVSEPSSTSRSNVKTCQNTGSQNSVRPGSQVGQENN